ncbi:MAG: hypothetical protein OXC53_11990, partial [Rhodobacteraceae bacterium]|nr:hypothetical protein [Paracoccaceae bacterium]
GGGFDDNCGDLLSSDGSKSALVQIEIFGLKYIGDEAQILTESSLMVTGCSCRRSIDVSVGTNQDLHELACRD